MKMKKYASFDDYLDDQPPKNRSIIRALRRFVKRVEPGLEESVKWGNGCWVKGKCRRKSLMCTRRRTTSNSALYVALQLKDPRGLLEGNGQYVGTSRSASLPTSTRTCSKRSCDKRRADRFDPPYPCCISVSGAGYPIVRSMATVWPLW